MGTGGSTSFISLSYVGMYFFTQYCISKNSLQAKIELSPLQKFCSPKKKFHLVEFVGLNCISQCVYLHTFICSGPGPR